MACARDLCKVRSSPRVAPFLPPKAPNLKNPRRLRNSSDELRRRRGFFKFGAFGGRNGATLGEERSLHNSRAHAINYCRQNTLWRSRRNKQQHGWLTRGVVTDRKS